MNKVTGNFRSEIEELTHYDTMLTLILENSYKYNQCIQETLLDIKYYEIGFSQKCNFIFIFKLSLFYGHYYEKQKLAIYVSKFLFISDPSPGKFQCFNSRRFSSYSGSINLYFMLAISWCHNYPMFNFILG